MDVTQAEIRAFFWGWKFDCFYKPVDSVDTAIERTTGFFHKFSYEASMKQKRKFDTPEPELLFVAGSSQDDKGRRVLVRDSAGPENWIWPPGADDMDVTLLGISAGQTKQITAFFTGGRV